MTADLWSWKVNAAIVAYLVKTGGATFEELHEIFGEPDTEVQHQGLLRFRRRMEYLRYVGAVTADLGQGPAQRYQAVPPDPEPAAGDKPPEPEYVGEIVPSAWHGVMHALGCVPDPEPALRAGALDYKAVPSRGYPC